MTSTKEFTFNSEPSGADVTINGQNAGTTTPYTVTLEFSRSSGTSSWSRNQVTFSKVDYKSETLTINTDSTSVVNQSLYRIAIRKRFTFVSEPTGADVEIDGKMIGTTTPNLIVSVGFTRPDGNSPWSQSLVTFSKADYQSETFTLRENSFSNVNPSSTVQKVKGLIYADSGLIFAVSLHYILDDSWAGGQF